MLRQHRLNFLRNELPIVRMDERDVFRDARRRAARAALIFIVLGNVIESIQLDRIFARL